MLRSPTQVAVPARLSGGSHDHPSPHPSHPHTNSGREARGDTVGPPPPKRKKELGLLEPAKSAAHLCRRTGVRAAARNCSSPLVVWCKHPNTHSGSGSGLEP